jgi:hypothetical protein
LLILDPSLAAPGKHVIHVYTQGNEPYALWQGMERQSQEYGKIKQQRAEVMWQALTARQLLLVKVYFQVLPHPYQDYSVVEIPHFLALGCLMLLPVA